MIRIGIAASVALLAVIASAPPALTQPAAQGQAQSASPQRPMMGHGPGARMGMRWGAQNTYGWSMMTPAERQEHMTTMQGFKTRAECQAYIAEHHRQMVERAKQRGITMPAEPRGNPCAGLN